MASKIDPNSKKTDSKKVTKAAAPAVKVKKEDKPQEKVTPKTASKDATPATPKADSAKESKPESKASTPASTSKKPTTMEELLAMTKSEIVVPQKGQSIKGKVKAKSRKMLVIDIGAKTEGIVTDREFDMATEYIEELKEGDAVEAVVLTNVTDRGQILLSLKQAAADAKWEFFTTAMEEDRVLEADGIEVNKGGLIVTVEGMRGFVPSSQFGKQFMGKIKSLKGQKVKVKAIEVDQEKNRLIFSERHVSEAQEIAQRDRALASVKEAETYVGVVSGVMPFGLFVTVKVPVEGEKDVSGHVEGLIHISEISWEKVNDPKDYHAVGDEIKVKVLGVDPDTGKLNLSLKQLSNDPWQEIGDKYQVGTTFTGTVSRVETFGIFVNVEAGVDGLIHSSKLTGSENYQKGEEVTVTVESVEAAQRRMSLSPVSTEEVQMYK